MLDKKVFVYLDTRQNVSHDDLFSVVLWEILTEFLPKERDKMLNTQLKTKKSFTPINCPSAKFLLPLTLLAAAARTSASQSFRRFWKAGTRSFFVISGPTAFWSYIQWEKTKSFLMRKYIYCIEVRKQHHKCSFKLNAWHLPVLENITSQHRPIWICCFCAVLPMPFLADSHYSQRTGTHKKCS